jgi:transcriptional regulator with XRE-family HTH domain
MTSKRWERLGSYVRTERARMGGTRRSLAAFAKAAGMSRTTLDSIEHGRKDSYDPATLATLEHALGWLPGSIDSILRGGKPKYDDDPDLTALVDLWPKLSPGSRRMLRMLAAEAAELD